MQLLVSIQTQKKIWQMSNRIQLDVFSGSMLLTPLLVSIQTQKNLADVSISNMIIQRLFLMSLEHMQIKDYDVW